MKYKVKAPDGTIYEIEGPDGATDEQILAAAQSLLPTAKPEVGVGQRVTNTAQDIGRGALKSVDMLGSVAADLAGMALYGGKPGLGKLLPKAAEAIPPRQTTGALDDYGRAAAEGTGAALTLPLGGPLVAAGAGALGGMGARLGKQLTDNPLGELLGSLLAGSLPMGVRSFVSRSNAPALAKEAIRDIPEANLDVARQTMAQAPLPINVAQALNQPSNIDDLIGFLAQSPQGKQVQAQLRSQPETVRMMGQMEMGALPGNRVAPQEVANRAQLAATEAISGVKKARTAAVTPLYNSAGRVEQVVPGNLVMRSQILRDEPGTPASVIAAAEELERRFLNNPRRPGNEMRETADINQAIREFEKGISLNRVNPPDPTEQRALTRIASTLREELGLESPRVAEANALYIKMTRERVAPLKKGVVGQTAGITGAQEDKAAAGNRLFRAFEQGTPDPKNSDILAFQRATQNYDQTLFPDAVSSFIGKKLDDVGLNSVGRAPETLSQDIVKALKLDSAAGRNGLNDMLAGVARSTGHPPDSLVKGFNNFITAAKLTTRRPGKVSGLNAEGVEEIAGKSKLAAVLTSMTPGRLGRKISGSYSDSAKSAIDKLLTTPEGLDKLRQLAKLDPSGPQAQILLSTILGGVGASGETLPQ